MTDLLHRHALQHQNGETKKRQFSSFKVILTGGEQSESTVKKRKQTDLCHDVLVEGEGHVGAAALRVAPGWGCGSVGVAPALSLADAGLHETMFIPNGNARLTSRTVCGEVLTVQAAGFWSTPKLRETKHSVMVHPGVYFDLVATDRVHCISSNRVTNPTFKEDGGKLYLCAGDSPVQTAAAVAVLVPSASMQSFHAAVHTGPVCR